MFVNTHVQFWVKGEVANIKWNSVGVAVCVSMCVCIDGASD